MTTKAGLVRDQQGLQEAKTAIDALRQEIPQAVANAPRERVQLSTISQLLDAAESIAVLYDPLPAVSTIAAARKEGAPLLAPEVLGNRALFARYGDEAAVSRAFAEAAFIARLSLYNHRVAASPLEPRGAVASFDEKSGRYTLHLSAQSIHLNRDQAARSLGVPREKLRFLAVDVGGGFGAKNFIYPEYVLLLWAAQRLRRPVKWIATRSEGFLCDHQARDHEAEAALALDREGRFLALRIKSAANLGAYLSGAAGGVQTFQYVHLPGTVYRFPAIALSVSAFLTNTTPIGVTRGPGFAESVAIIERLIDEAARQTGCDRARLRSLNMVPESAMPMTNALGRSVDSGAFGESFEKGLAFADVEGFPARQKESEARGLLRGLGFAYHIKGTGGPPSENVEIRFLEDDSVLLITGTQTIGQGHETTFPQILAERLGMPEEKIRLCQGDTDLIPSGGGHGSSRATYMGGTAIWRAALEIIAKGRKIAAEAFEADEADIAFADGAFEVRGTDRRLGLLEAASLARKAGAPLDTYHLWTREALTYPNGAHVAEVEIDPETGLVALARYSAVDDYGVLVNPMIAKGQAFGAIAQGVGQALLEECVYDRESGQPLAGSFLDYALPRAKDLVPFALAFNPKRCRTNPLGVKGCGEAGAVAAFPAVVNAIRDALAPFSAGEFRGPATPERIWRALRKGVADQPREAPALSAKRG